MRWPTVSIGEVVTDLRSGFASGGDDPGGVVQFRMNNVERSGELNWTKLRRVPQSKARKDLLVDPGDILFNATNSPDLVGKTALFDGFDEPITFSNHFLRLRSKRDKVDPAYLSRWLQREFAHGRFAGMCRSWVNQASITKDQLASLEVPLPPLDEQRRIAAILEKADALRRRRKRALELLDGLTQSIFLEIFGDPLRDGPRWSRIAPLSQLANIGSGITKGRKLNGSAIRSVPYLAVANVQDKALDLRAVKTIDATDDEIARYRLEVDDLLLTEGGDPDKLGRGTLWSGELSEAIHQNHVFRVRVASHEVLPLYLNWLVGSSYGKAYFLRLAKQTTGIASINKTQLSEFPVIVPPIDKQILFVDRAKAVSMLAAHQSSVANHIQSLFSSLQHRAFAGELQ